MTVHVAARHVEEGVPRDGGSCPIALALHELGFDCCVTEESINFFRDESYIAAFKIPLPYEAAFFVAQFDAGRPPGPFDFELDLGDAPADLRARCNPQ